MLKILRSRVWDLPIFGKLLMTIPIQLGFFREGTLFGRIRDVIVGSVYENSSSPDFLLQAAVRPAMSGVGLGEYD